MHPASTPEPLLAVAVEEAERDHQWHHARSDGVVLFAALPDDNDGCGLQLHVSAPAATA